MNHITTKNTRSKKSDDTIRLDWVEKHKALLCRSPLGPNVVVFNHAYHHSNYRKAIDFAMRVHVKA